MAQIGIIECRTRAQMRAFLSLGDRKRLFRPENGFIVEKNACDPGRNALLRSRRHLFLLAQKDGKAAARLLLIDGGERAWFALFAFRDEGAALRLIAAAKERALEWGAGEICGPISPDGSGFMLGAPIPGSCARTETKESGSVSGLYTSAEKEKSGSVPGAPISCPCARVEMKEKGYMRGAMTTDAAQRHAAGVSSAAQTGSLLDTGSAPWHPMDASVAPLLEKAGFSPETTLAELEIGLAGRKNPYAGAADFAMRHGGIVVRRMALGSASACRAAYHCSADAHERGYEAFARMIGRIVQLNRRAFALIAFRGNSPAGWVLCAPEKQRLRLLHMQIRPENRRGPCAAALLERAWQEAADSGADTVRASTIDLNNESSLRMAKAAGGRIKCAYGIYLCKISPESA